MGLQLPERPTGRRVRRLSWSAAMGASVLALAGCSAESRGEWERLAMPDPASEQGEHILNLWQGAWTAALITGLVVWGLIFYSVWRFRRRSDNEIPVQTRYNLPLEIFYTIAPIIMVIVFFNHTVKTQNIVLEEVEQPDNIIEVTGQQWQWVFNHGIGGSPDASADEDRFDNEFAYEQYVSEVGTGSYIPELYLPVGETTRFNLHSPDVVHNFGIPGFIMRMDVIPGRVNHYEITPTREGTYAGKCYELCGVAHSRMLFTVRVVSPEEYDAYLGELEQLRGINNAPLLGSEEAYTQSGLETEEGEQE